jgi:hypothetical protein
MDFENGENPEMPQEAASAGGFDSRSARMIVIGAFAAGVLAGGALAVAVLVFGRTAMERLELGNSRPRRMRIGNLEIEERGDNRRFHVQ